VLTILIFPTEIVLTVLIFPTEIVLTVLLFLTEIVLTVLLFLTAGLSANSGHYFCYARHSNGGDLWLHDSALNPWRKLNDMRVTLTSWAAMNRDIGNSVSNTVYSLLYKRLSPEEVRLHEEEYRSDGTARTAPVAAAPAPADSVAPSDVESSSEVNETAKSDTTTRTNGVLVDVTHAIGGNAANEGVTVIEPDVDTDGGEVAEETTSDLDEDLMLAKAMALSMGQGNNGGGEVDSALLPESPKFEFEQQQEGDQIQEALFALPPRVVSGKSVFQTTASWTQKVSAADNCTVFAALADDFSVHYKEEVHAALLLRSGYSSAAACRLRDIAQNGANANNANTGCGGV
jgi:hypothetical protein